MKINDRSGPSCLCAVPYYFFSTANYTYPRQSFKFNVFFNFTLFFYFPCIFIQIISKLATTNILERHFHLLPDRNLTFNILNDSIYFEFFSTSRIIFRFLKIFSLKKILRKSLKKYLKSKIKKKRKIIFNHN